MPPLKKETGKVQPKKETVRINLPPKPSTAPTIKMPTLPPGGPTGAASHTPSPTPAAPTASAQAQAAAPRAGTTTPAAAPRAAAAPAVHRPVPVATPTTSTLDKILAIAVLLAGLFAAATTAFLAFGIPMGN